MINNESSKIIAFGVGLQRLDRHCHHDLSAVLISQIYINKV